VLVALFFGTFAGALVGLTLMAGRRLELTSRLPFGTFLALGALVALFSRGRWADAYLSLL
jgi:leader peptidase (prepilin peptidase)/N-methyltransferase